MSAWLKNNGLDTIEPIHVRWEDAVKFVLAATGVDKYLLEEPCSVDEAIYQNAVDGWNNGNILDFVYLIQCLPFFQVTPDDYSLFIC
jgi:hypothetical protein